MTNRCARECNPEDWACQENSNLYLVLTLICYTIFCKAFCLSLLPCEVEWILTKSCFKNILLNITIILTTWLFDVLIIDVLIILLLDNQNSVTKIL